MASTSSPSATRQVRLDRLVLAAALTALTLSAQAGVSWSLGVQLGLPVYPAYGAAVGVYGGGGPYWHRRGPWVGPWQPGLVLVAPPVLVPFAAVPVEAVPSHPAPAIAPAPRGRPEPVVYPRDGQSPQQTESDHQACNRWATTQPTALADADVFRRAVEACMDARGYTIR